MILSAVCCTWKRPHYLGELIESFLRQDYPAEKRELVILDDAGQYGNIEGDRWKIISIRTRFTTLGEKRNACAALVRPDCEGLLVADDDDLYLPHWFTAHAVALAHGEWSWPARIYLEAAQKFQVRETRGIFHGAHAFRRSVFLKVFGYRAMNSGQDQDLFHRLKQMGVSQYDTTCEIPPYYVYRFRPDILHLSALGKNGYEHIAHANIKTDDFKIGWHEDYLEKVRLVQHEEESCQGIRCKQETMNTGK
ncbi:MAG: glycosyltransferase family 2 protein [Planctomycetaceae bacterium]|nr:glycosyltransferase family 2 protein [Planctomycetaceae bacterium]